MHQVPAVVELSERTAAIGREKGVWVSLKYLGLMLLSRLRTEVIEVGWWRKKDGVDGLRLNIYSRGQVGDPLWRVWRLSC